MGSPRVQRTFSLVLALAGACGDGDPLPASYLIKSGDAGVDEGVEAVDADGEPDDSPAEAPEEFASGDASNAHPAITIPGERFQDVARDFCKSAFECDADEAELAFFTEDTCREDLANLWRSDAETVGTDCAEAELVRYACYASTSCEEQETTCSDATDAAFSVCPDFE